MISSNNFACGACNCFDSDLISLMEFLIRSGMQLFLINQEFLIIWNSSPTFPVVFLFLELLVQLNYPLKACQKSYFWLSEGSEISKFSGALPLTPVGGKPPSCFLPRYARSFSRLAQVLATMSLTKFSCFFFFRNQELHPCRFDYFVSSQLKLVQKTPLDTLYLYGNFLLRGRSGIRNFLGRAGA